MPSIRSVGLDNNNLPLTQIQTKKLLPAGNETILLVEDHAGVRKFVEEVLRQQGYTLLVAENPQEALTIAERHSPPIHLLLTDVIMPGDSGQTLANKLLQKRPGLKIIYISGYSLDIIAQYNVRLNPQATLIQKPFNLQDLVFKIRQVLDA